MSNASPQPGSPQPPGSGGAADPSMEDILASIRRILSEDEGEQGAPAAPPEPLPPPAEDSDVLALDPSMLVEAPPAIPLPSPAPPPPLRMESPLPGMHTVRSPEPVPLPPPAPPPEARPEALLGPEAAAAAASSVGSLLRTLVSERQQVAVYRGGPTIEDMVREEIRPLLKLWLDANLPPLVERLVRAEIERVVGRAIS